MTTDRQIYKIVREFRSGMLGPRGRGDSMCFAVCGPLVGLLRAMGIEAELRMAWLKLCEIGTSNHFWIELPDGRVIDPTADQFNHMLGRKLPKIYFGPPDADLHPRRPEPAHD